MLVRCVEKADGRTLASVGPEHREPRSELLESHESQFVQRA
jgi:hypothetical protein